MTVLTGSCLCSNIQYRIDLPDSEPIPKIALCHCTSCKRATGSSFSSNILVPTPTLAYTRGSPKIYDCPSDRGPPLRLAFCADCGSPLTTQMGDNSEVLIVKTGTLNDEERESVRELGMEIYAGRRDGWLDAIGKVHSVDGMV
ncbi:Mss4-like protein [Aspergillus taichungensis]|uniref:Mss4-like protein n=1 Tax=Aspergillus taichungensis TaxID=482145 RepID=A0A2J5I1F1_9EURO|nr:Mss4-like protein [Aspergillus taichungensis]